jgi:hypothetical protein
MFLARAAFHTLPNLACHASAAPHFFSDDMAPFQEGNGSALEHFETQFSALMVALRFLTTKPEVARSAGHSALIGFRCGHPRVGVPADRAGAPLKCATGLG